MDRCRLFFFDKTLSNRKFEGLRNVYSFVISFSQAIKTYLNLLKFKSNNKLLSEGWKSLETIHSRTNIPKISLLRRLNSTPGWSASHFGTLQFWERFHPLSLFRNFWPKIVIAKQLISTITHNLEMREASEIEKSRNLGLISLRNPGG